MIGKNLKLLRKQFVKSQDEVSKALDLNRSTYSGYENAVAQPSIDIITKICDYYNIATDVLLRNDFSTYTEKQWNDWERWSAKDSSCHESSPQLSSPTMEPKNRKSHLHTNVPQNF